MKIFNKFIWSKKEPSNKNDIWFDGSTWRMYTEEAWQSFTLPVDAADKVAKVLENASEVYQEKLNAGYGIIIEGNTISLDDSIKYDDSDVWEAIETLQQNKVEQTQLNDYVTLDRYGSTAQMLVDNINELYSIKVNKNAVATINGQSLIAGGNIVIPIDGASNTHNIGSIDLFEQIIAQKQTHDLTLEDKEAILNGKVITASVGNGTVPTISITSIEGLGLMLMFHFNERLYSMCVMWNNDRCYINGVFSFTQATKLFADSELSETSENSVQNKVVTEKLAELSEENERLRERIEEQDQFIEDLQNTKIDRENDDYYPKMAVGTADNLAGVDVVDSEINFRRSGGGAITDGVARIESIKGNSVVWNQLLFPYSSASNRIQIESDGVTYAIGGEITSTLFQKVGNVTHSLIAGHKYYIRYEVLSGNLVADVNHVILNGSTRIQPNKVFFITADSTTAVEFSMRVTPEALGSKFHFAFYDLTQMFGAGNEPTTIEEFYARIPMGVDLNAYNEGEVIHMDVQSIESQGVNQWDEEWELGRFQSTTGDPSNSMESIRSINYFPIMPNTSYYATYKGSSLYVFWFDKDKNYIGNKGFYANYPNTSPSNAAFAKFYTAGTTYNHDICINISDTAINGKYFPYIKRVEDLAVIRKYFPEGMKSAPTAHDAIRYNKASGKWEKVVRIGEIDFSGAKAYTAVENTFLLPIADMKAPTTNAERGTGLLCAKYPMHGGVDGYNVAAMSDKSMLRMGNGNIYIKDSAFGSDATAFKAAMDGVMLYYELAEPIVTELDAEDQFKDLDYQVWNCGTEKAIAEGKSAPLAADITYGFNAIGKIKELESLVAALRAKVGI